MVNHQKSTSNNVNLKENHGSQVDTGDIYFSRNIYSWKDLGGVTEMSTVALVKEKKGVLMNY